MRRKQKNLAPDAPLLYPDHPLPVSRRDFIRQGLMAGLGVVTTPSLFGLFANPGAALAALSPDLAALKQACGIATQGAGKIPFICFDLAGGANISGSNVLVGQTGGQLISSVPLATAKWVCRATCCPPSPIRIPG